MELWTSLLDILILLGAAMLLGGLCERIKQSPLVGYLLAGVLLGPNALNVLPSYESVYTIAELGVALLLFTIGLEFSWRRLLSVGRVAAGGGTLQVLITGILATLLCRLAGVDIRAAIALGAMVAMSSTAAVVRVLASRAEIDTVHGRNALGILLLQDMALVPLALLVAALSVGGGVLQVGWAMLRAVGLASVLAAALFLVVSYALPRLLSTQTAVRNRDFSILLAIVTAAGASWLSHALGFSPVLGAFVAGMVLAESPFATQIRADIVPLQTLFVTLFFSSIGMFSNPAWVAEHWAVLAGAVAVIVFGKTVVTAVAVRLVGGQPGQALATGVVLAQIGEFSLVLAVVARDGGVIAADHFDLAVAALIVTLFLTPYLAALAPRLATAVRWRRALASVTAEHPAVAEGPRGHIVLVGFGPAGQRVAETLMAEAGPPILVVDLNTANLALAESYGLTTTVGDIRREEVLERMHVHAAVAIVVTVPDPGTSRQIIQRVRSYAPDALVVVRSRYHVHRWQLEVAGAHAVVDEEDEVGARVAMEARRVLRECGLLPPE
jgi:CPA2 family monovalent cation:H+ antiporter-2